MGKTTRKMLSILITVVMVMTCMPVNGLLNADAAAVYHIYMNSTNTAGYIAETEDEIEGCELVGLYIDGGSYEITGDVPDNFAVILNNAEVTGFTDNMMPLLLGQSRLAGESEEYLSNNDCAYTGDIKFDSLFPYAVNVMDTWVDEANEAGYSIPLNYTMVVTGDMTIDYYKHIKSLVVDPGATLTVRGSGCELDVDQLTLNGTINITDPTGGTDPNGMRIRGTATRGENAAITAAEGSVLRIDEGASVPDMTPGEYSYHSGEWKPTGGGGDDPYIPDPVDSFAMRVAFPAGIISKAEVSIDGGESFSNLTIENNQEDNNEQVAWFDNNVVDIDNVMFRFTPAGIGKKLTAFVMWDPEDQHVAMPFNERAYSFDESGRCLTISKDTGWGAYYDVFIDIEHVEAQFHFEPDLLSKIEFAYDESGTYEEMWNDEEEWTDYIALRFDGEEHSSVSFRLTPKVETAKLIAEIMDFENWDFDPDENVFTITRENASWSADHYDIEVRRDYDYYIEIGYPHALFASLQAKVGNDDYFNVDWDILGFDEADLAGKTSITFLAQPLKEEWGVWASYAMVTDQDESQWVWTDPEIASDGSFTIPLSVFAGDSNILRLNMEATGFSGIIIEEGWDRMSDITCRLGDSTEPFIMSEPYLDKDVFEDYDSVTFYLNPYLDVTVRRVLIDGEEVTLNQDGSFVINKNDGWDDRYNISIETDGHEPGPQFDYDIGLWYPDDSQDPDFSSITYRIDDGDTFSVDMKNHNHSLLFNKEDIEGHNYIIFDPVPVDPNRQIVVQYANHTEDPEGWNWTSAVYDNGYKIPLSMFTDEVRSFVVDIFTEQAPFDKTLALHIDKDLIPSLSYKLDDGDYQDIENNQYEIGFYDSQLEDAENLYLLPPPIEGKTLAASYGKLVDHGAEGRYVDDWINIVMNPDGSYTFPVSLLRSSDSYAFWIGEDEGGQPEEPSFCIEAVHNFGGRIVISPDPVSIHHVDDNHEEFYYNCDEFDNVSVSIEADPGFTISSITIDSEPVELENDHSFVYTIPSMPDEGSKIEINAVFAISDSQMIEEVARHGYAYYYNSDDFDMEDLTEVFASEMYFHFFREGTGPFFIAFSSKEALKAALDVPVSPHPADDETGLPYADFVLNYHDVHQHIKVYILPTKHDVMVECHYIDGSVEPIVVTVDASSGTDTLIKTGKPLDFARVFGNGVDSNGIIHTDSPYVSTCHLTQEQSGFDYTVWDEEMTDPDRHIEPFVGEESYKQIGLINTRLVNVYEIDEIASLKITGTEDCPGWAFGRANVYTADAFRENASKADVYIANRFVLIENVDYENASNAKLVTGVAVDEASGLNPDIITVSPITEGDEHSFAVSFNTNYDMIPLALTYSDGVVRYITIHRIAIEISTPFINAADNNKVNVPHGTWIDDWRSYEIDGAYSPDIPNNAICATYYYPTGSSAPSDSDKVTLFVTINWRDGTQETRVITDPLVSERDNWSSDTALTNKYWADYIVWAGSENDIRDITSVEIFAYNEGSGDVFGGVKAGSEHGFVWANDN
ncbi:MAG: hypothetical protein IKE53_04005 [Clostridiales bacterium]|nr:hypothetical protein [Clostridiales bacterium]